jgi:hypothetical protein
LEGLSFQTVAVCNVEQRAFDGMQRVNDIFIIKLVHLVSYGYAELMVPESAY